MKRAAFALLLILAACGAGRKALVPVSLPDISTVSQAEARRQLRDAYASLDAKIKNPDTPPPELADAFGEMGRLLMAAEFVVASEPFFRNAETLAPDDRRWPYFLGHVYRTRGDTPSSAAAFERARTLAPSDEATLVWLGAAYLDEGRLAEAKDVLNKALAGNPRCVAALYRIGRIALTEHDDRKAVDAFERGLAIDARATILQYPLATAYQRIGDAAKADAHLKLRGDVDVGPVDPLMQQLGELLDTAAVFERRAIEASKVNDWKSAAMFLRKAVALDPNDASLRHKLGTALSLSGEPQAAIDQLQLAVRMTPADVDARYNLAQLLLSSGRAREAASEFQRVVHDAPNDADARAGLAEALGRSR
jgi:tetratricopeptide (TPR) repeat protein